MYNWCIGYWCIGAGAIAVRLSPHGKIYFLQATHN